MNKGEIFTQQFVVMPGESGSFIVSLESNLSMLPQKLWAFSNIGDLLHWLDEEASAWQAGQAKTAWQWKTAGG